jgi:hypothetical protein
MAKLLTLVNIFIMPKFYTLEINEYLHANEVHCSCNYKTCNHTLLSQMTIDSFYRCRIAIGEPLFITSAYRCVRHNIDCGGSDTSSHVTGHALDISKIDDVAKQRKILKENWDVVIEYETFFHCHNNPKDKVEVGGLCV